jgi:hypothetical protein
VDAASSVPNPLIAVCAIAFAGLTLAVLVAAGLAEIARRVGRQPGPVYRCPRCGSISAHPRDIAERYCARCDRFETPAGR